MDENNVDLEEIRRKEAEGLNKEMEDAIKATEILIRNSKEFKHYSEVESKMVRDAIELPTATIESVRKAFQTLSHAKDKLAVILPIRLDYQRQFSFLERIRNNQELYSIAVNNFGKVGIDMTLSVADELIKLAKEKGFWEEPESFTSIENLKAFTNDVVSGVFTDLYNDLKDNELYSNELIREYEACRVGATMIRSSMEMVYEELGRSRLALKISFDSMVKHVSECENACKDVLEKLDKRMGELKKLIEKDLEGKTEEK